MGEEKSATQWLRVFILPTMPYRGKLRQSHLKEETNMTDKVKVTTPRNPVGRPTSYTEDMPEKLLEYFRVDVDDYIQHSHTTAGKSNIRINPKHMPSILNFCESIGITTTTFHDWRSKHKEFSVAYTQARELYEQIILNIGFATNSTFATFMLKANFGYRDNTEIVVTGDANKPVRLKIVSERPKDEKPREESEAVDWGDD